MVRKLVSVPPSQRLVTKNMPERARLFLDDVLRLALGADEEDVAAAADRLDDEVERALEEARRLVEVDDVDAVARAVDERAHLRVPALGLVAEVDARVEERAEGQRELAGGRGHEGCRPTRPRTWKHQSWHGSFRFFLRSPSRGQPLEARELRAPKGTGRRSREGRVPGERVDSACPHSGKRGRESCPDERSLSTEAAENWPTHDAAATEARRCGIKARATCRRKRLDGPASSGSRLVSPASTPSSAEACSPAACSSSSACPGRARRSSPTRSPSAARPRAIRPCTSRCSPRRTRACSGTSRRSTSSTRPSCSAASCT